MRCGFVFYGIFSIDVVDVVIGDVIKKKKNRKKKKAEKIENGEVGVITE